MKTYSFKKEKKLQANHSLGTIRDCDRNLATRQKLKNADALLTLMNHGNVRTIETSYKANKSRGLQFISEGQYVVLNLRPRIGKQGN